MADVILLFTQTISTRFVGRLIIVRALNFSVLLPVNFKSPRTYHVHGGFTPREYDNRNTMIADKDVANTECDQKTTQ
jgi:hypothetical protein